MDLDRPHQRTRSSSSSSNELSICFTSHLSSSSSMKISKSILSPGWSRERDQPMSLPTCLSKKLRTNGSIRGGQASPMFTTTTGKKRGSALENPEPSSPKVTCIGQVRIKSKKKKRNSIAGDVSLRRTEEKANNNGDSRISHYRQQQQQECLGHKWVHFPLTICEALGGTCLFPCRRSCTTDRAKEEDTENRSTGQSSRARWLVTLQDGEGGKGREVELMLGGDEERREVMGMRSTSRRRRHVLEDFEIKDETSDARVSICIPPKDALLLMRCRSDPVKAAALTNRFCIEAPVDDDDDEEDEFSHAKEHCSLQECEEAKYEELKGMVEEHQVDEQLESDGKEEDLPMEMEMQDEKVEKLEINEQEKELKQQILVVEEEDEVEANSLEVNQIQEDSRASYSSSSLINLDKEDIEGDASAPLAMETASIVEEEEEEKEETEDLENTHQEEEVQDQETEPTELENVKKSEELLVDGKDQCMMEANEKKDGNSILVSSSSPSVLPDCLLLMMFEPKLSMEVSKETWVCSTDFVRWLPQRPKQKQVKSSAAAAKKDNHSDEAKKRVISDSNCKNSKSQLVLPKQPPPPAMPPRSSCSLPAAAVSMAAMIEHKLVNAGGYEPFVLTRCKSEPMRTAAKLAPDPCF